MSDERSAIAGWRKPKTDGRMKSFQRPMSAQINIASVEFKSQNLIDRLMRRDADIGRVGVTG